MLQKYKYSRKFNRQLYYFIISFYQLKLYGMFSFQIPLIGYVEQPFFTFKVVVDIIVDYISIRNII